MIQVEIRATRRMRSLQEEAFDMYDSLSEGSVFYGRALVVTALMIAMTLLVHVI